ncbi:hypothetical protein ACWEPC_47505 [Nonomuraea sp. NPDC004297]
MVIAVPAQAHVVDESAWLYRSDNLCGLITSEVSDGNGYGYAKVETNMSTKFWWAPYKVWLYCTSATGVPAGRILLRYEYLVFSFYSQTWGVCMQTDWYWNTSSASRWRVSTNFGGYPPCGEAWYATLGFGLVSPGDGHYYGGTLASGNHWFTTPYLASVPSVAKPAMPTWVGKDGTVDLAAMPRRLPVIDETGHVLLDASGQPVTTAIETDAPAAKNVLEPAQGVTRLETAENGTVTGVTDAVARRPLT